MNQKNIDVINICLDWIGAIGNEKSKADIKDAKKAFGRMAEKQIPKKPIKQDEDCLGCPKCDSFLTYESDAKDDENYQDNYCSECGQAIKWEGE